MQARSRRLYDQVQALQQELRFTGAALERARMRQADSMRSPPPAPSAATDETNETNALRTTIAELEVRLAAAQAAVVPVTHRDAVGSEGTEMVTAHGDALARAAAAELRAEQSEAETRAGAAEAQAKAAETQTQLSQAQAQLSQAEVKLSEAEVKLSDTEAQLSQAKAQRLEAEARTGSAETRAASAETRAITAEAQVGELQANIADVEAKAAKAEARAAAAESESQARAAAEQAAAPETSSTASIAAAGAAVTQREPAHTRLAELEQALQAANAVTADVQAELQRTQQDMQAQCALLEQQLHEAKTLAGDRSEIEAVQSALEEERGARVASEEALATERDAVSDLVSQCDALRRELSDKDSAIQILVHQVDEVRSGGRKKGQSKK